MDERQRLTASAAFRGFIIRPNCDQPVKELRIFIIGFQI